jgi:flagellar protein FlgJ
MIDRVNPYWDVKNLSQIKTVEEAAEAFEAFFVRTIMKEFRKSIPEGMFNKSFGSKMYMDMFDMQISQVIASSDQLKLKEFIIESIQPKVDYNHVKEIYKKEKE